MERQLSKSYGERTEFIVMNFKLHIISLLIVFSFACEKSSQLSHLKQISSSNIIEEEIVDKENELMIEISEIGSMCNFCSSYKISVFSNGKVDIESRRFVENNSNLGEKFIEKTQKSNQQLLKEQFKDLISEFENIGFFEFEHSYIPKINCPQVFSDSTTLHVFYSNGKKFKTVNYYQGCKGNEQLAKLANLRESLNKILKMDKLLTGNIISNTNNNR